LLARTHGILPRSTEISQSLLFGAWNFDRAEFTRAQQAGKLQRVATVGLHAVAGAARDQRGRHHDHLATQRREQAVKAVTCRPRLVSDAQGLGGAQFPDQFADGGVVGTDDAKIAGLAPGGVRHSDGSSVLVDVETNELRSGHADLSRELRLCTRRKPPCNPRDFTQEGPSMLSNICDSAPCLTAFLPIPICAISSGDSSATAG